MLLLNGRFLSLAFLCVSTDHKTALLEIGQIQLYSPAVQKDDVIFLQIEGTGSIAVCPGFILRQERSTVADGMDLLSVSNAHFGTGSFWIETEPTAEHGIWIHVSASTQSILKIVRVAIVLSEVCPL